MVIEMEKVNFKNTLTISNVIDAVAAFEKKYSGRFYGVSFEDDGTIEFDMNKAAFDNVCKEFDVRPYVRPIANNRCEGVITLQNVHITSSWEDL